jgi:hypothetical protein
VTPAAAERPATEAFASQYESLRSAALGEPLAPESRAGLVLFLRRGMWAWARARFVASRPPTPRSPSWNPAARTDSQALAQVLAALALPSQRGRAQ